MYNVVPDRKVVERWHEIRIEFALSKVFHRVCENAEPQRIREQETNQCRAQHEEAAKSGRSGADREERIHQSSEQQAGLKSKWICKRVDEITEPKSTAHRGRVASCYRFCLLDFFDLVAHRTAKWADLYVAAV